jgi:hypothetical protein
MNVPHDEWFENPLDSMPIATDKTYVTDEYAPCDVEYDLENPDEIELEKEPRNIHEAMYQFATKNGTTITMGGSENVI